jgi:hypothetical protein
MRPQLAIQGVNIVLRGNFNPVIFHPTWLAAQGLIRFQEADAAEIEIVHPQIAQFTAEWLQISVTTDRFQASTTQEPYYEPLRDLVVGIFDLVVQTPLTVLGINRNFHYRLESESAWHAVGHRLVPKQDWKEVLLNPGMLTLVVEGKRPDNLEGYIRVKVEPSAKVTSGVYIEVNDHYALPSASESPSSTREALAIVSEQWTRSMQQGLQIAEKIVSLGECK